MIEFSEVNEDTFKDWDNKPFIVPSNLSGDHVYSGRFLYNGVTYEFENLTQEEYTKYVNQIVGNKDE